MSEDNMSESIEVQNLKTRINHELAVFTEQTGIVISDIYVDARDSADGVMYDIEVEELK